MWKKNTDAVFWLCKWRIRIKREMLESVLQKIWQMEVDVRSEFFP